MSARGELHKGHRKRFRLRMKEVSRNDGRVFDHELLELLLFRSIRRANTNDTAHMLVNKFGSVENALAAAPEELREIKGIGKTSAAHLKLWGEILRVMREDDEPFRVDLCDGGAVREYLRGALALSTPPLRLVAFNNDLGLTKLLFHSDEIETETLFSCLPENTAELVTVHYVSNPFAVSFSGEIDFCRAASEIARRMEIDYIDHCVFDGEQLSSMNERGMFPL